MHTIHTIVLLYLQHTSYLSHREAKSIMKYIFSAHKYNTSSNDNK